MGYSAHMGNEDNRQVCVQALLRGKCVAQQQTPQKWPYELRFVVKRVLTLFQAKKHDTKERKPWNLTQPQEWKSITCKFSFIESLVSASCYFTLACNTVKCLLACASYAQLNQQATTATVSRNTSVFCYSIMSHVLKHFNDRPWGGVT